MKKTKRILILLVTILGFTHPQKLPTHASKLPALQSLNPHQTYQSIPLQSVDIEDSDWIFECVDRPPKRIGGMSDRSLQLDANGYPHIAYGGDHLYYAFYDGATWQLATIDQLPEEVNYVSLVLDANGFPHIGYYDKTNLDIKYAYQNTTGWHIQIVVNNISFPFGWSGVSNLGLDGDGQPHISYGGSALYYAHLDSDSWQILVVESAAIIKRPSLVIDSQGYPHIAYTLSQSDDPLSTADLRYAYRNNMGWQFETIYASTSDDSRTNGNSFTLDENDRPHIIYTETYNLAQHEISSVKYAWRHNSSWLTETVGGGDIGSYSLALDHNGDPRFSHDRTDYWGVVTGLEYSYRDTSGWNTVTLNDIGWTTSLVIDAHNHPHISYFSGGESTSLIYAEFTGSIWEFQTVDTGVDGSVGAYNSLIIDSSNKAHISYYDGVNGDLKYARRDIDGWKLQSVDSQDDVGKFTSIALDNQEYPHISYDGGGSAGLKYIFLDESGWHPRVVSINEEVFNTSLALDENKFPHINFYGSNNDYPILKYAYQDQSGWQTKIVDDRNDGYLFSNSLALDKNNNPHISYSVRYSGIPYLNYAVWNGSIWEIESVESYSSIDAISMVLDSDGYPHISYFEEYSGVSSQIFTLNYAYQDASGWHVGHVTDNLGFLGSIDSTTLALDDDSRPHISYVSYGELKYVYLSESGWKFQTIYDQGQIGTPSLALDKHGYPHISYNIDNILMYAYIPAYRVVAEPTNVHFYGKPGDLVTGNLSVKNLGQETDSYNVSIHANSWITNSPEIIGPLMPGEINNLSIQVTIPPTATLGSSDSATITLTSQNDPCVTATVTLTTYAALTTYLPLVAR